MILAATWDLDVVWYKSRQSRYSKNWKRLEGLSVFLAEKRVSEYEKMGPSNEDSLYAGRKIHLQRTKCCRKWAIYNRHFAFCFNYVYMWYCNIKKINNGNGVKKKNTVSELPMPGDLKLLLFFKYVMDGSPSLFSSQPYPLTSLDVQNLWQIKPLWLEISIMLFHWLPVIRNSSFGWAIFSFFCFPSCGACYFYCNFKNSWALL